MLAAALCSEFGGADAGCFTRLVPTPGLKPQLHSRSAYQADVKHIHVT
jgi:hypothetical protein